ncbi:MAG: RNA polymerase sigma factor [candidate division KSB1 bacterium]
MIDESANAARPSAQEAIPALLEKHGGLIYSLGQRMCGSHEGAQDLVQETFLRAFKSWHQFEGRADPATWLYKIAVRACQRLKRPRAGQPQHMLAFDELLPESEKEIVTLADAAETPLEEVMRHEAYAHVEQALAQLPAEFRLALVLKEIADFSVAEVARILNLKEATVKTRVHRGRLLLRKTLAEKLPKRAAPPHEHAKRACLDLLHAKQQALDRGVEFPLQAGELCAHCSALFATLDLAREACLQLRHAELPQAVRKMLLEEFHANDERRA